MEDIVSKKTDSTAEPHLSVVDHAILWPKLENFCTKNVDKLLPYGIPANIVTLIGNIGMLLAVAAAALTWSGKLDCWGFIPFGAALYLFCDCIDGDQSRRTHTQSSLGNWLDHSFDILIMAETLSILLFAFDINNPATSAALFFAGYLALFGDYYEIYYKHTMVFEAFSAFEMIVFGTIVTILGFVWHGAIRILMQRPIQFDIKFPGAAILQALPLHPIISVVTIALTFGIIVGIITGIKSIVRTGKDGNPSVLVFLFVLAVTYTLLSLALPFPAILIPLSLYPANYVQRFFLAFLNGKKEPIPDMLFPVLMGLLMLLDVHRRFITQIAIIYGIVCLALVEIAAIYPRRKYWVWYNKTLKTSP
jgi:ethanolaminephosphotransferase